jgi:hypothetical protein
MYTEQHDDEDLVDCTRCFRTAKDFFEAQLRGKLSIEKMANEDEEWDDTDDAKMKECHEQANARLMALLYLENVDQNKYGTVLQGLMDQFSLSQDQYPKTINHATSVVSIHKIDDKYFEFKKNNQEQKNKDNKKLKEEQESPQDMPKEINSAQLAGACYCDGISYYLCIVPILLK